MRSKNFGDLYIRAITEVPVSLSKEQKTLLEKFKKIQDVRGINFKYLNKPKDLYFSINDIIF